jgi:sugar phosphate isomerase/epimerase
MARARTVGVMQGRLSEKPGQPLQSFPWQSWRDEFARAAELGFDIIEWLLDGEGDRDNPIASPEGRDEIARLAARHAVGVRTLCAHTFIDGALLQADERGEAAAADLARVLGWAAAARIELVTLPAVEGMSLRPPAARDRLLAALRRVLVGPGPVLLLESDLPAVRLAEFVASLGSDRLGVLYDLGNAHALGFDIAADLTLLRPLLREVHVKDRRTGNGASLRLGEGGTPLAAAADAIAAWKGPIVLETPIFGDWRAEAVHNLAFTRQLLAGVECPS